MDAPDSALDPLALETARRLLAKRRRPERMGPVLAAAAFAAVSAMSLAFTAVLAPPAHLTHLEKDADGLIVRK